MISNRHVLTASHCVDGFDKSAITIRLGEYSFDQQGESPHKDFQVSNIKMHEQYDTSTYINDIAILTLDRTTDFSDSIWPICLPPRNDLFTGDIATVIGWGTIYFGGPTSPVLQEVSIPVWENAECNAAYPNNEVFDKNLCAGDRQGGKDSCQGDSGGKKRTKIFFFFPLFSICFCLCFVLRSFNGAKRKRKTVDDHRRRLLGNQVRDR